MAGIKSHTSAVIKYLSFTCVINLRIQVIYIFLTLIRVTSRSYQVREERARQQLVKSSQAAGQEVIKFQRACPYSETRGCPQLQLVGVLSESDTAGPAPATRSPSPARRGRPPARPPSDSPGGGGSGRTLLPSCVLLTHDDFSTSPRPCRTALASLSQLPSVLQKV